MARTKTTETSSITAAQLADGDLIPVIDVSDTTMSSTGTNKKLAKSQLAEAAGVTAHLALGTDAHDASAISFSATGNIVATDVQAAIAELDSEKAAVAEPIAAAHIADTSAAHAASAVSFSATGSISSTDVQAAIAEVDSDLTAHTGDTSDAHDASAISVLDTAGNYTATDVEAVLAQLPSLYRSDGMFPAAAYGLVVADGVTNCYAAIAAAITAAGSAGTVLLPDGTVSIGDNTLTVPIGVSIRGCGRQSSTIKSTSASGKDVISLTGSRNTLSDFRIQGTSGGGYAVALASGANRITLENLQIESAGAGGIKLTQSNFLIACFEVEANSVTGNGFDVLGAGTHNALTFIACYANSCTGNGFQIYSAKGVNLVGCSADNNGDYGYQMATARVNLNGCTAENNTTGGYYVVGSGVVKMTVCSTASQLLPVYVNGAAETLIESLECTSTPSGHCVTVGAGGTNVRNRMVGGTLDRSVSISSGGYLIRELSGTGSPEGSVVGSIGSTYRRVDGGANTSLYVKESGFSNTGWVGK